LPLPRLVHKIIDPPLETHDLSLFARSFMRSSVCTQQAIVRGDNDMMFVLAMRFSERSSEMKGKHDVPRATNVRRDNAAQCPTTDRLYMRNNHYVAEASEVQQRKMRIKQNNWDKRLVANLYFSKIL